MKKIIAILLAMVMVIGLVACSNDKKEDATPTKPSVNEETQEPTTSEPTVTEPEDETTPSDPETEESVTEGEGDVENEDATTDGENADEEDKTTEKKIEDAKDKIEEAKDKVEKSKENKKEQNDKVDETETTGKVVVKIEDTSTPDMNFAQAIEVFYKDETYEYYYNCIFSQCIIVTYADGTTENMKEALNNGNITIADLDAHGIGYMKRLIGGLDKVDK